MYIYSVYAEPGYDDGYDIILKLKGASFKDAKSLDRLYCRGGDVSVIEGTTIPYPELKVTKVIFNNPATIVFWSDGTKTVVKCGKGDTYDKEKGFYIACTKKLFGNDYKAVGRINKALEMAEDKHDIKKAIDRLKKALEITEDKNG